MIKIQVIPPIEIKMEESQGKITLSALGEFSIQSFIPFAFIFGFLIIKMFSDVIKGEAPFEFFVFALFLIFIGGSIGISIACRFLKTKPNNPNIKKIIVDTAAKIISSPTDHFEAKFSDIKGIVLSEKSGLFSTTSLLKFQLVDGEKTLLFPFPNYTKAQEILNLIKSKIV